jgi:hypothetical protein
VAARTPATKTVMRVGMMKSPDVARAGRTAKTVCSAFG